MIGARILSVAEKLRYMILLVSGVALLAASFSYVLIEIVSFRQSMIERISVISDITTTNVKAALVFNDRITAKKLLSSLNAESTVKTATLFTKDMEEFASFTKYEAVGENIPEKDASWQHTAAQTGKKEYRITLNFFHMLNPVYFDDELIGYLHIDSSVSPLFNMLDTLLSSIMLVWLTVMVGVYFLGAHLQRRISGPIEELIDGMHDVTKKQDYSIRLPIGDQDEIGKIVQKFNDMLKQVQSRDERLSKNRQELEDTVEKRTHELQLSMQDAITSKELAEQASRAKSEFLATMSHEIRTPMNGVLGMSDLMLHTELTAKQKKYADIIQSSGKALLKIINDILDFSKIEAGQMELECIDLDVAGIIDSVLAVQQTKAQEKGLNLISVLPPEQSVHVKGDPGRLQQIMLNLTENAIKFTEHGQVSVVVDILPSSEDTMLLGFEVKDTGIGISQEAQQKIFDMFSQADGSTTRQYGGTGLGLSICKRLVELMGGQLSLDSIIGQGSSFKFSLPMPRADKKIVNANQENDVLSYAPLNARILLVEDNLINQEVALDMLEAFGCKVDLLENGEQALEKLQQTDYALVLMDCQMPVKDGYEATREIRLQEKTNNQHTIIVALTANAQSQDRDKCLAAGMDDFISKPFDTEGLYTVLDKWLSTTDR